MSGREEKIGYSLLVDEEQTFEKKIEERKAKGRLYVTEVREIIILLRELELFKKCRYIFEGLIIAEQCTKKYWGQRGTGDVKVLKGRRIFQLEVMLHFNGGGILAFIPGEWTSKLFTLKQNLERRLEQKVENEKESERMIEMKEKREKNEDLAKAFGIDLNE